MITNELITLINRIKADCVEWNTQNESYSPNEMKRRRDYSLGLVELIRCFLGIFIYPKFGKSDVVYVFEGLRNKDYMAAFDRSTVVVIGSHEERRFAKINGYGFIWSFPVDAAVRSKVYRDWSFFISRQILRWSNRLKRKKNVIFFLYEDTQPLGTFLAHVSRCLPANTKSVCIQHGYFSELKYPLRYEGKISDINFVWDERQAQLMGLDRAKTFSIGLPYSARAHHCKELPIVLVGIGAPYSDLDLYMAMLNIFTEIARIVRNDLGRGVIYRPHPTEFIHSEIMGDLDKGFEEIDALGKIDRLNSARSIFIGTISSFLYEAKSAGHFVVFVDIDDKAIPVFEYDLKITPLNLTELIDWIKITSTKLTVMGDGVECGFDENPLTRFRHAVIEAKLLSEVL